jgi:DNA-directed RNA polymerase subunit RPC12/RpoP
MVTERDIKTFIVDCPDCGEDILLRGKIALGLKVVCPNCSADLEVIDVDPVELDWSYDYDYDDEEDDEDEDW